VCACSAPVRLKQATDEAEEVFFSEAPKSADSGSHILVPNAEKLRIIGELKF